MTIRFKCPHCQKTLGVKDHLAGKKANCPACKKVLRIPAPPPSPAPAPATAPAPAPVDVEAAAASVFGDEPAPPPEESTAKPILFTCNWCAEEVQFPAELAGKQAPCPNPECKRIVKVPVPKVEKKDWRDVVKTGPSGAAINRPEKLDGVMGSPDDKGKVSQKALIEAGIVKLPPKPGIGVAAWVRRGMLSAFTVSVAVGLIFVGRGLKSEVDVKTLPKILPSAEEIKKAGYAPPLVAEFHRILAKGFLAGGYPYKALLEFQTARGHLNTEPTDKGAAIERDMALIELLLAQSELGGTDDEKMSKVKLSWKDEMLKELKQTLGLIKSSEARVWALRELSTRLLEKDQSMLAIQLASDAKTQVIAVAVKTDQKKLLEQQPKEPDPAKEPIDHVARVGYAEGYARKGKESLAQAQALAQAKGPARDQLEALVGVAAVLTSMNKHKVPDEAKPILEEALKAADAAISAGAQKQAAPPAPWVLLQLLRLASRVDELKPDELTKRLGPGLPPEFRPRAALEVYLARCDKATEYLRPPEVEEFGKNDTVIALAFEATARQNAWFSQSADLLESTKEGPNARYRLMVNLGHYLGQTYGRP
jgi:hypothetical protein